MEKVDHITSNWEQEQIDKRAKQLDTATDRENLGLAIKHDSVATIKKVGDTMSFTEDELKFVLGELKKCRKDIIYFAEKYFRIIGDGGLQIIKLYPKQKEMLLAMQREKRIVVLAPRQAGKCGLECVFITIKNKKTNEIQTISLGDFFNKVKKENKNKNENDNM